MLPPNSASCSGPGYGNNDSSAWGIYTPSSFHAGGVQMLMADGWVRWINNRST